MNLPDEAAVFTASVLGRIESAHAFPQASSASVWGVRGTRGEAVLRLFTNRPWLEMEPDLAAHEAAVLELVSGCDIAAPELLAVDTDGSVAGVPAVLMSRLPGAPVLEPADPDAWLDAMLEPLLRLDELDAARFGWSYRPWFDEALPAPPDRSARPATWIRARELATTWQVPPATTLVHRDYHPGNILWHEGRLSGVVDWVNGCCGPIEIDVAGCAFDIALLEGCADAFDFVRRWERRTGRSLDPHWLLISAIETGDLTSIKSAWDHLGTGRPLEWYWAQLDELLARSVSLLGEG